MLKKLLKYDLQASARILPAVYGLIIMLSLVLRLFNFMMETLFKNEILYNIFSTVYYLLVVVHTLFLAGTFILTLFFCIQRFYLSVVKGDAYLTLMLPIPRHYNIISKTINAVLWEIVCFGAVALSTFIAYYSPEFWDFIKNIISSLIEMLDAVNAPKLFLVLEMALLIIVSLTSSVLMFFAAISIGQVISRKKLLGAVGGYAILYFANSFLATIVMVIFNSITLALTGTGTSGNVIEDGPISTTSPIPYFIGFIGVLIVYYSLLSTVYFLITKKVVNKKLNLE